MARLIDADDLKTKAIRCETFKLYDAPVFLKAVSIKEIDRAPTMDAVPIRHGKIIETIENGRMKRVFSCCGTDFTKMTCWMTPNYCPECGAKIDKEKNE